MQLKYKLIAIYRVFKYKSKQKLEITSQSRIQLGSILTQINIFVLKTYERFKRKWVSKISLSIASN